MVSVTFHQICITTLSLGLAAGVLACATKRWNSSYSYSDQGLFDLNNDTRGNSIKALVIVGVCFMGFGLLLEILMMASNTFKLSRAVNIICLMCCVVSVAALLSGLIVYGANYSTGGYSVWLLTACSVFALEALFFYVVQWRCS